MVTVVVFGVVLVGVIVGAAAFLMFRERSRSHGAGEGALIEARQTAEAARMRAAYPTVSVHESILGNEELFVAR
ncbi:hypothetical protein [Streptomyces sp. NRRL WC-3742]|uniref:hypothetical protein n=1 Tax=Streptomyces sp. NRRL WC-3742 TaxID=1463934 RepID=UPI0004C848E0|nr:hypothetical protein [Streptomyces sp. NRRL WC-3742]